MFEIRICSNNEKTFFNSFKSDKNSKGGTHLTSYLLPGALSTLLVLLLCGTDVMHSICFSTFGIQTSRLPAANENLLKIFS